MFKEIGEENLTTIILLGTVIVVAFVTFVVLLAYLFTSGKNKLIQEKQLMKTQLLKPSSTPKSKSRSKPLKPSARKYMTM